MRARLAEELALRGLEAADASLQADMADAFQAAVRARGPAAPPASNLPRPCLGPTAVRRLQAAVPGVA